MAGERENVCQIRTFMQETTERNDRRSWEGLKNQNNLEIKMSGKVLNTNG